MDKLFKEWVTDDDDDDDTIELLLNPRFFFSIKIEN
jgi:hypothetical protein